MKYYIIYLCKGKVIDIASFAAAEHGDFVAQYKRDKLRLECYAEYLEIDEIQTLSVII